MAPEGRSAFHDSHAADGVGPFRSIGLGDPELDAILRSSAFDDAVAHAMALAGQDGVGTPEVIDDAGLGKVVRSREFAYGLHQALATIEMSDMSKVQVGKVGDAFVDDALRTDKLADGLDRTLGTPTPPRP